MKYISPSDYDKVISNLIITSNGYWAFTDKEHPLAYKSNYRVYLHRHNASLKLNRWLTAQEHVHHLDEDKLNNSLDNLVIYSNSAHAKLHHPPKERVCSICKQTFRRNTVDHAFCSLKCKELFKKTKIVWPSPDEMQKLIWEIPCQQLASKLGVSDKAIEKFCKKNNLTKPPRGYWQKLKKM